MGALAIMLPLLGIAFLASIAILWTLAGPVIAVSMVAGYVAVMYALWRVGISRL